MATTGPVNTKLMRTRFINTGTPTSLTCQTDATLSVTNGTRQTTCKDSGQWEEHLYGQTAWEISGTMYFSYDATNGGEDIYDVAVGQTVCEVAYGTSVTGDLSWTGNALVTKWDINSPGTNETVECAYTFKGTGPLTKETNA